MKRSFPSPNSIIRIGGRKGSISYKYLPRCPACDYLASHRAVLVDEADTFAIKPQEISENPKIRQRNYRYQEYVFLSCEVCHHTWNSEPTARWSTRPDRLTSEPYSPRPCRHIDTSGFPISEPSIHHLRVKRYETGRFSEEPLAESITNTRIMMISGAGASVPFGFPAAKDFGLSDQATLMLDRVLLGDVVGTFLAEGNHSLDEVRNLIFAHMTGELLQRERLNHEKFKRYFLAYLAKHDMEIIIDVLLKLQQIAVQEGDDKGFENALYNYGLAVPSWFVFGETLRSDYAYPPLTMTLRKSADSLKTFKNFQSIRALLEGICIEIMTKYDTPDSNGLKDALVLLKPLIDELLMLNNGPLPVFTFNYDQLIETMFGVSDEGNRLFIGFENEKPGKISIPTTSHNQADVPIFYFNPEVWHKCNRNDVALFHLHGSSRYFIEPHSNRIYFAVCPGEELALLHQAAWESAYPVVLGAIVPATCKERYAYTPPFGIMYDYLNACLAHAEICVIVGVSGRDHMIKWMLDRAGMINPNLRFLMVTLGEPSPHLTDVIPQAQMDCWKDGFNKGASEWIHQKIKSYV